MLRITIELVPHGVEARKRTLHVGTILHDTSCCAAQCNRASTNDGSGSLSAGNYTYRLQDRAGRTYKSGEVKGFPRQKHSAWRLLALVLYKAFLSPETFYDAEEIK